MIFHRHVWKVAAQAEQPSLLDKLETMHVRKTAGLDYDAHERPVIVTYRCAGCGSEKVERV